MRNSRNPLIPQVIREQIEAIESKARTLGWPAELLWNTEFWGQPRGLASVLEDNDEIIDVTTESISIMKLKRDIQHFYRNRA